MSIFMQKKWLVGWSVDWLVGWLESQKQEKVQGVPKKWCIAIPLLPGQGENIQQSEGNQWHN